MSTAKPTAPNMNGGHAGAAIARAHDGRSTIGITPMVMTTGVAIAVGSQAIMVVPANGLTVHGQDDRAKGGCIDAAGWNNRGLVRHRIGRRRLALSAITRGQS